MLSVLRPNPVLRVGTSGIAVPPDGVKVRASASLLLLFPVVLYPPELPCRTRTVADFTMLPAGIAYGGAYPDPVIVLVSALALPLTHVAEVLSCSMMFAGLTNGAWGVGTVLILSAPVPDSVVAVAVPDFTPYRAIGC